MKKIIALTLGITLIDQLTKFYMLYWVTSGNVPLFGRAFDIVPHAYMMARVNSFFNIVFTWNPGTSFSMFRSVGEMAPVILIALTAAIIGYFAHSLLFRAHDKWEKMALSLIVGGAIGNLIDRVRFGAVVDFLDFHYTGIHWPAFNFADIFIVVGVAVYIGYLILRKK